MTALDFNATADAIAALTVSGVTLATTGATADSLYGRDCPRIFPQDDYVTGLVVVPESVGAGSSALCSARYSLNYWYFHAAVGSDRGAWAHERAILTNVGTFGRALLTADLSLGIQRAYLSGAIMPSIIPDRSGNQFIGCAITVDVWELINGS